MWSSSLNPALGALHKPEWIAAVALSIQAVILGMQWRILGRHAKTMEEHKSIAGTQAKTAELIGQALQQHGTVLNEQIKIMDEQFKFQRRIDAKSERENVFNALLDLETKLVNVSEVLAMTPQGVLPSEGTRERLQRAWRSLEETVLPCMKTLITAIHLPQDDRKYFIDYAHAVDDLTRIPNRAGNLKDGAEGIKKLQGTYKDFSVKLIKVARTPL